VKWHHPQDGGNIDLWNIHILPKHYMASQTRRLGLENWNLLLSSVIFVNSVVSGLTVSSNLYVWIWPCAFQCHGIIFRWHLVLSNPNWHCNYIQWQKWWMLTLYCTYSETQGISSHNLTLVMQELFGPRYPCNLKVFSFMIKYSDKERCSNEPRKEFLTVKIYSC